MSNTTGEIFRITSFGTSHGKAIGAIVDGCPANLKLSEKDIQKELNKRKPGTSKLTTPRKESDKVEILSGIFNGKTDGTPICCVVYNNNQKSKDYENIKNTPRPGHGDYGWISKFGNYNYNGGGRGSGRVTIGHVIGGAIAKKLLYETYKIKVFSHVIQIGDIIAKPTNINEIEENTSKNPVRCSDLESAKKMENLILEKKAKGDSVGGIVETIATGVPAGIGEPVFGKLDGDISKALMEIGAVKGVEIGLGFNVAKSTASQINDEFYYKDNKVYTKTNNSGGIIGGISDGMPIITRIGVKPTPSISINQETINIKEQSNCKINIKGRHDPCICPRITTVSESAIAIVLADHMIRSGYIHPNNIEKQVMNS